MTCLKCEIYDDMKITMKIVDGIDAVYMNASKVRQCPECYHEEPCPGEREGDLMN